MPNSQERIHSLIAPIVQEIVRVVHPESVVLAGSYGRGEGILREKGEELRLVNDVDLVVVFRSEPTFFQRRALRRISEYRVEGLGVRHIDIISQSVRGLASKDVSMLNLDLKFGGAVLWGNATVLDLIPCKEGAIPSDKEVLNLLINRMVTLLEAHPVFSPLLSGSERARQLSKVFFALVDSWGAARGTYRTLYREKIASLHGGSEDDVLRCSLVRAVDWAGAAWRLEMTEEYAVELVEAKWAGMAEELTGQIAAWTTRVSGVPCQSPRDCIEHWRGDSSLGAPLARAFNSLRGRRHKFLTEKEIYSILSSGGGLSRDRIQHSIKEWYRAWA